MSSAEITIDQSVANVRLFATVRFEGSDDMASALAEKWAADITSDEQEHETCVGVPRIAPVDWSQV